MVPETVIHTIGPAVYKILVVLLTEFRASYLMLQA